MAILPALDEIHLDDDRPTLVILARVSARLDNFGPNPLGFLAVDSKGESTTGDAYEWRAPIRVKPDERPAEALPADFDDWWKRQDLQNRVLVLTADPNAIATLRTSARRMRAIDRVEERIRRQHGDDFWSLGMSLPRSARVSTICCSPE